MQKEKSTPKMQKKKSTPYTEFTGPGSAFKVIEQYNKGELDASRRKPAFISPEVIKKNKPKSLN
jgi:hypothetical protein